MWIEHWGCSRDPFTGPDNVYVPLRTHEQAVGELTRLIESAARRGTLLAEAGLGKTRVLKQAIIVARDPRRRFHWITCSADGVPVVARLAERLGDRSLGRGEGDRFAAWRSVERSVQTAAIARTHLVFVIDDCHRLEFPIDRRELEKLASLGADHTIIEAGFSSAAEPRQVTIRLERLTRSDAEFYLRRKLDSAGCRETVFTPRAVTRLHALSEGVPRALEHFATLSMIAGADRGLEVITPDLIDALCTELEIRR